MSFRAGVRKCNAGLVNDASSLVSHLLFSARNHPIYQNIVYQNYLDRHLMPNALKILQEEHVSTSRTGKIGKCQGG